MYVCSITVLSDHDVGGAIDVDFVNYELYPLANIFEEAIMVGRAVIVALALLLAGTRLGLAQEIHSSHCLHGCPAGGSASNDLIIREIYILSSNDSTKFADWVAYKVTASTIGPTRSRNWKSDPALDPTETLEPRPDDYRRANSVLGTDRGHQVPLASFTGTPHWRDTNYLSNITPQMAALNQGPWQTLESRVRDLARAAGDGGVFVMTGPLYERAMAPLPEADEAHTVPSGYWKVVAIADGTTIQVAAFVFDQLTPRNSDICTHITTIRAVEQRSRLNLYHALPTAQQDQLETGQATLRSELGC